MFSIITIASSTTKPVAIVSAIRLRLLIEKPAKYMTPKVPMSDSGTAGVTPGTWYFKGVTRDSVYINLNNISFSLLSILNITDSTMSGKLWGTAEYWYFVKYP